MKPVILSGDIGVIVAITDNSHHVVTCDDTTEAVIIDGCHISAGNANGTIAADQVGAGLLNHGQIAVTNCAFTDMYSTLDGHTIYNSGTSAELTLDNIILQSSGNLAVLSRQNAAVIVAGEVVVQ